MLILVILLPALYAAARAATAVGDMWSAHRLAPLVPVIGGTVDRSYPCIRGVYRGRNVRVFFSPKQGVGSGDSATRIRSITATSGSWSTTAWLRRAPTTGRCRSRSRVRAVELEAETGDLLLRVGGGTLRQHRPVVYQEVDGVRREVESGYTLKGAWRVGFRVGE